MSRHPARGLRPSEFVDSVFQVHGIAKRAKSRGKDYFFTMTLADSTGRFNAIAGKAAASCARGQAVHVRGCVLARAGQPVIVACSLIPVTSSTTFCPISLQWPSWQSGKDPGVRGKPCSSDQA